MVVTDLARYLSLSFHYVMRYSSGLKQGLFHGEFNQTAAIVHVYEKKMVGFQVLITILLTVVAGEGPTGEGHSRMICL